MSMKTRIRGFTAWVNLRLKHTDLILNNVLMDLLTGTNIKVLIESITGRDLKKLQSFDGLTQQQKITRVEWIVAELRKCDIIPEDIYVDTRMFAMRSADHIFDLLWRLISHDIWFVWERAEYLQHRDDEVLCQVPFKWVPAPPPPKKKTKKAKKSLLSGFGASGVVYEDIDDGPPDQMDSYDPFPGADVCKSYKSKKRNIALPPAPDDCIIEMVNAQLRMTKEGKKLNLVSIDELVDSRVLCSLINSLIPNTFTTEVLLNDRWTINLVLRAFEKMMYADNPFDSEDLVEADPMSVCAYFCFFFMVGYKYRQSRAVVDRYDWLNRLDREANHELDHLDLESQPSHLKRKKELDQLKDEYRDGILELEKKFDIRFCQDWMSHIVVVQKETHKLIREKIKEKFDILKVPRNITINDICLSMVINLSLTNGSGFYHVTQKEQVSDARRIILRHKASGEFIDDFTAKNKEPIRRLLRLPAYDVVELNAENYPQYDIYVEAASRNKSLKSGTEFLYQVFPGNMFTWQRLFIRAARDNEFESVQKLVVFFRTNASFINCREHPSGNTALHWAARMGHYHIVQFLLENGAQVDAKNNFRYTPLFSAIEGMQRSVAHLLIEWGCDVHIKSIRGTAPLEAIKNDEFRHHLTSVYEHYTQVVPKVMEGDTELLAKLVRDHVLGVQEFSNLRSRCVNGSTLLHTSAYFGAVKVVEDLLQLRVDVNLQDYKGATPLHRAKDVETIKLLLDAGGLVNSEDHEGNMPLHVKCYGEMDKSSETECIKLLLENKANITARNHRSLMPIHCAAMQGRDDVIKLLVHHDTDGKIKAALEEEKLSTPPSLVHLAIANDFLDCATWLLDNDINFKDSEQDILLQRILTEQIKVKRRTDVVRFLLDHGANPSPRYVGGNTALHYAASMVGSTDVLELLIEYGADIDDINDDQCTPLFFATQCNNQFAANILIDYGANVRCKNVQGLTAFDCILDFDEWIECGYFSEEIKARLKAYSLKHSRDLIRAISKKVKGNPFFLGHVSLPDHHTTYHGLPNTTPLHRRIRTGRSMQSRFSVITPRSETRTAVSLPPLKQQYVIN
ncbi:uncharacterized protein LOC135492725 [Lineus longissimus]|uniref:uncharacterized protein LOC135492725 n=1 Tax=Lineus longissimus TaxID=88925 RepID=UPI002B4E902A